MGSHLIVYEIFDGEALLVLFLDVAEESVIFDDPERHQPAWKGRYTSSCAIMLLAMDMADSYSPIRISLLNFEIYFFKFMYYIALTYHDSVYSLDIS